MLNDLRLAFEHNDQTARKEPPAGPRHKPDRVVDDLLAVLRRAHATDREVRLLLALIRNLGGWP